MISRCFCAEELPDDRLNLANLTRLYKAATLAKALKITLRDYVALRALDGHRPVRRSRPRPRASSSERGWSANRDSILPTLDYLLRHRIAAPAAMTDAQVSEFLARLRAGLLQIAADHEFASDPTGARTAESLALIIAGRHRQSGHGVAQRHLGEDKASQTALINDHFAQFLDPAEAANSWLIPARSKRLRSVLTTFWSVCSLIFRASPARRLLWKPGNGVGYRLRSRQSAFARACSRAERRQPIHPVRVPGNRGIA